LQSILSKFVSKKATFLWLSFSDLVGLFIFADRTDRARIDRALDGNFVGDRASSRLGLAIIAEFENRRDGGDAKAAANAEILVNFNFLSHDFSSNMATLGL
jgi:hypothetical protein